MDQVKKKDAAFLLIKSKDGYFKETCRILISWRFDTTFGFAGGEIEEGETPLQAALRECYEETNFYPSEEDMENIEPLSEYDGKNNNKIYSFVLTVPKETLSGIVENSRKAKDSKFETCGFNDYMLYDKSLENLVKLPFSGTAKQELKKMLKGMNYQHETKTLDELFD